MNKTLIILLLSLLGLQLPATAEDFVVGDLLYTILDEEARTVSVKKNSEVSGDLTIPESVSYEGKTYTVTEIGESAFYFCDGLISVTIHNRVATIGESAFYGCNKLRIITMEGKIPPEIIGNVFDKNDYLKIYVPEGASHTYSRLWSQYNEYIIDGIPEQYPFTIIDNVFYAEISDEEAYAQSASPQVEKADIAPSLTINGKNYVVTAIPSFAFYGCNGLTTVYIPNSVTEIGSAAFYACNSLTSVPIPNSVTRIGAAAFSLCRGLTSMTIPNSVTKIGDSTFSLCKGLTSVIIGNGVTKIGGHAFNNCSSLAEIKVLATVPPGCYDTSFYGVSKRDCILYVPEGSVSAYEQADYWKEFYQIIGKDFSGVEEVADNEVAVTFGNGCVIAHADNTTVAVYTLEGQMIDSRVLTVGECITLPEGVYIINVNGKAQKVYIR